jgi:CubicO group peptidase (beta-lactamase class C family)
MPLQEINDVLSRHREAGEITGGIVLVAHKGDIVYLEAQGTADQEPKTPLSTETIFWMASMTKPYVAAAIMLLLEENRLRLDDPVARYIPEFSKPRRVRTLKPGSPPIPPFHGGPPDPDAPQPEYDYAPAQRDLTVRDFLTFTSGLQTIGVPNDDIPPVSPDDTLATWTAKLGDAPLEFQPGTQWHYSNATGYEVLARIVEVVSGQTFAAFLKQRIFDPLGMKEASFGIREDLSSRILPLEPMLHAPFMRGYLRGTFHSGSAGLFMTARDYWRFAQMLLGGGELNGTRILKEESVREMTRNQIGALPFAGVRAIEYGANDGRAHPGLGYGYGVAVITDGEADMALPTGSYGWDGIGTRRFWNIPSLQAVLIMLMPGLGSVADATHRDIEYVVVQALS